MTNAPADAGPHYCAAAAELALIRGRAAELLARPWRGPETTAAKQAVREVLGEGEGEGDRP